MTLKGKFVIVDEGEAYRTGEVVASPCEGHYLVRFDAVTMAPAGLVMPTELYHIDEMVETGDHEMKRWDFFDTAADRRAWLEWLDRPPSVRLVKKDGEKPK